MPDLQTSPAGLTPAAERIVAAASELFYTRGIRAVGVDLIADRAGTTKKTLYDRFGSKDALVAIYLARRAVRWQEHLAAHVDGAPAGPDRLLAVFEAAEQWSVQHRRGCAFVNAFAEFGGTDHPAITVIRAEKDRMRQQFTELAAAAGHDDAERMGATAHLLYEGALVAATVGGDGDAFATARAALGELLR